MKIKSITLENFRNYEAMKIDDFFNLNILTGLNASGKTNFLESIYLSAVGKSIRTNKDKDLIKWNKDYAYVKIVIEKKYRSHTVEIHIDNLGKKRIAIDKLPILKSADLMGFINVVYFSPDELKLVKEAPDIRRKFIDISLCQQSKSYFFTLQKYNNILNQRNKLLKNDYKSSTFNDTLPIWDRELSKEGAAIILKRLEYIKELEPLAKDIHKNLSDNKENLSISYERDGIETEISAVEKELIRNLEKNREKDISLGYTTSGPHRDDIKFTVNDTDVRKFGSQGQQRTTALSLKLAETKIFKKNTNEIPVLHLDDVLSELDKGRTHELIKATTGIQTFITCTEYKLDDNLEKKFFIVNNGTIKIE
jgi:DNA replication and repair protein RecF